MPRTPSEQSLQAATTALAEGMVIACPTEAVWGLSCDPFNEDAVNRLLALKSRAVDKGLILVAAGMDQLDFLFEGLSTAQLETLSATWPGPATWLVPHGGRVPAWISGVHDTVAVRVSDHPVVSALCKAFGGPLVSTSANPAGAEPAREEPEVRDYFGDTLGSIVPGATGDRSRPTSIRDLATGQVIRE